MAFKADLHLHTTYSDGYYSPAQLIEKCKEQHLEVISITDHDSLFAFQDSFESAKKMGIEIIPGVELSSDIGDKEVHILGYFIDVDNQELKRYLKFFQDERLRRTERIIKKLQKLGLNIVIEDVLEIAKNSAVGRPHIAQALVEKGQILNYYEAFNKYIGDNCPAYERKVHISPASAFKIINDAGGLSFIAHPDNMSAVLIRDLIDAGVDGIEAIHPTHNEVKVKYFKEIAGSYFLLNSGGSDFHGGKRNDEENLGKYFVNMNTIEMMKKQVLRKTI
jgi:hypothetical protein